MKGAMKGAYVYKVLAAKQAAPTQSVAAPGRTTLESIHDHI